MTKKHYILTILLLWCTSALFAQTPTFTATVDRNQVSVDDQFEVSFTLNSNGDRFQPPNLSGFIVLAGPNVSTSMSSINGVSSMSIGYSYILAATKEGTVTIGAASIAVNGKMVSTKPIRITVTKKQLGRGGAQQQQQQQSQQNMPVDDNRPMGDVSKSIFIKAAVDKTKAYAGQQLTVTYKLYTRVPILESQLDKLPELNGFWSQDMNDQKQPQNVVWRTEIANGMKFNVADIKQTILLPQKTGNLTIDPLAMTFIIRQQAPPRDAMEQFFGGSFKDVKVKLKSQAVTVKVTPLPEAGKPADFGGAVGVFDMKAMVDRTALKTSESLNYNVRISGTGNIMLINNPMPNFPSDFEKYDPKTTDTISKGTGRISGSRFYNFLLIPRHEGKYTLPPLTFSYFNPATEKYVTLTSKSIDLTIGKGKTEANVSSLASSDKVVEKDIRGIKKNGSVSKNEGQFFGSTTYNLLLLLGPLAFIGALAYRNINAKRNSDVVKVRSRKASKIAAKHLATAKKALAAKDSKLFYEAVFKGIYGYLADKLNIPYANLDKEVIAEALKKRSAKDETIAYLEETLDLCDMARFAPVTGTTEEDMFERAKNTIDDIEDEV